MSGLSTGAIIGIVVGILAFVLIKLALIYTLCKRRRQRISKQGARSTKKDSPEEIEAFLRQLKEHEFACHDIKICRDHNGNEIELGKGGYGRVLLGARNEHQPVAVKQLLNPNQKAKSDFLNEINLLKHVSLDANIVQYFGACVHDDQLWLVTEYMEGRDLRKALSSGAGERLTWWNGGKQIALDAARGLAFLHSRNVIHGDMKSHNILLTNEGKAKVADVGMAQIISDREACRRRLTQRGTLAWAAPELLVKGWEYTEKVDIFALGVCLWEIVTSQMPIRGAINVPSADDCPSGIISLIHDCMKYHPQDRPSAKEVYRRLVACEPHTLDFGGILDSAEGGGRRSQVVPRGDSMDTSRGPGTRGIRQSFQTFTTDSHNSTREDTLNQRPRSIELVEEGKAGSRSQQAVQEALSGGSKASEVDEKVELKSASPRYYRPDEPLKSQSSEASQRQKDSSGSVMNDKLMSSLPSNNDAFSNLVARYSQVPPEASGGPPDELQDTAILSTVDADLSHIPSLHNTQDPLARDDASSFSSMGSNDDDAIDAWLDPPHDILSTPPPQTASTLTSPDPMFTAQEGWDSSNAGGSGSSFGDDTDELESAKSVQGYAGSERSLQSKAGDEEAAARTSLAASYGGSTSSEGANNDLTSHHLEVPQSNEHQVDIHGYNTFRQLETPFAQGMTPQLSFPESSPVAERQRSYRRSEQQADMLGEEPRSRTRSHNSADFEGSFSLSIYSSDSYRTLAMQ